MFEWDGDAKTCDVMDNYKNMSKGKKNKVKEICLRLDECKYYPFLACKNGNNYVELRPHQREVTSLFWYLLPHK